MTRSQNIIITDNTIIIIKFFPNNNAMFQHAPSEFDLNIVVVELLCAFAPNVCSTNPANSKQYKTCVPTHTYRIAFPYLLQYRYTLHNTLSILTIGTIVVLCTDSSGVIIEKKMF